MNASRDAATAETLNIRAATADDEPAILALLGETLAGGPTGERTAAFFRWKHHANPFGRSLALVGDADGRVVGFRTFLRWRFRSGGQVVRAARPVDTATAPDWQGRGVFTRLTRAGVDALADDTEVIFNTPNAASLPGYRKLGWSEVGTVPIQLRVRRPLRFVRHVAAARRAVGGAPVALRLPAAAHVLADPRLGDLLAEADRRDRGDPRLATDRNADMLRWRFAAASGLDYRALAVDGSGGALAGVAIVRGRRRGPLHETVVADVVVRDGDEATRRRLLRDAVRAGGDHAAAHLPADTALAATGRRLGFVGPPGLGMTLAARALADVPVDVTRLDAWRFALADLEVF